MRERGIYLSGDRRRTRRRRDQSELAAVATALLLMGCWVLLVL